MKSSSYFHVMANLFSWFSLLMCLLFIWIGINKGFDISDEGFYVLLTVPTQENQSGIINYDLFFKLIFQVTGISFSLIDLRLIRLVGYFFAGYALTEFLESRFDTSLSKSQIYLFSILGLFSGYAFLPPTLSYNSLTVVLACFWLNTIFYNPDHSLKSVSLGLILAFMVYVKITVALGLLFFSIGILILKGKFSLRSTILLIIPFLILEGIFWIWLEDCALARLSEAIPFTASRPGYGLAQLIKTPLIGLIFTLIGVLIGGLIAKSKERSYLFVALSLLLSFGLLYWLIRFTHVTDEWNHAFLLSTSVFLGYAWGDSNKILSLSLEEMTMFFLPFLLHFGSNVYWLRIGIHYWVFWGVLILLKNPINSQQLLNLVGFLAMVLVFNGIWWHPFGQEKPLWTAKVDFNRGGEVIKVEESLVEVVGRIQHFAINREITQIQTAYRIPGLIWLAGYQIPYSSNVWDKNQLQLISPSPPNVILYSPIQSLPEGWIYTQSQPLGSVQGNLIYLLWN